jgi:hypothetical protein
MRKWWLALALASAATYAADAAKEMHGSADTFATPGAKLAWAIERGKTESDTNVVVRVMVDTKQYPWLSVTGIDPFTKKERVAQAPTMVPNMLDVRVARAAFADYPNTEFRFYASEAQARAGKPDLVVFYHGVPDTAPEFPNDNVLDSYLIKRIVELK